MLNRQEFDIVTLGADSLALEDSTGIAVRELAGCLGKCGLSAKRAGVGIYIDGHISLPEPVIRTS